MPETSNHVLQICQRKHGPRVGRHNADSTYVVRILPLKGFQVFEEPKLQTPSGIRKPDIVATRSDVAYVIVPMLLGNR